MFYTLNKLGLVALYAAAAASFFITLPVSDEVVQWIRLAVVVLLGLHLVEVVVFRSKIALYQGSMAVSVLLTVLFGFLHWLPLSKSQR
jgi:hypothetical protein